MICFHVNVLYQQTITDGIKDMSFILLLKSLSVLFTFSTFFSCIFSLNSKLFILQLKNVFAKQTRNEQMRSSLQT